MTKKTKPAPLRYVGRGQFLPNVPMRDLTEEEVAALSVDTLIKSNLYVLATDESEETNGDRRQTTQ